MKRDARFEEKYYFTLENMECRWLYLFEPDEKFACWKVDIILPEDLAKEMAEVGFNVKDGEYDGRKFKYVQAKRKTFTKKGPMSPPKVWDADMKPVPPDTRFSHGTVLNISVAAEYTVVAGKEHLPLYLQEVQVVKPIVYNKSPFSKLPKEGEEGGTGEDVPF